ncbi:hypothetical protein JY96_18670 [Aquabacterium sp. NJ1]|uniref:hypothetical protein n=1 Tax=Aquabacterium sp. NJ1 TaxID=1538295 RepID=UPI00052C5507|nr:hypothetical protein [Aquabacterium sp. NJ1]KGM41407.1 hypothetical protein JY96_18670 [Aquabacterium sp. NJ1]
MQTEASGTTSPLKKTHLWLIALVNLLLAAALTLGHAAKSRVLFKWRFLVDFDGEQPFQSRVLTFMIANGVDRLHPLGDRGLAFLFMTMDFTATVIAFIFVWKAWSAMGKHRGSLLTMFFLFWWQLFATFVASSYNNYYYPYDMTSLAFMAVGVWMIVSKQPWLMLLAFCVPAMMNRETAILLPFFYLAFHWPAWRTVWRQFLALLAVSVAVKLIISAVLGASSDDMVSLYHVPGFLRLYYNFAFIWLGPEYRGTANVFFAFGFAWVLLFMRGQADTRLRNMMLCFIPFFLGMMVVGNLSEIRIFAEFIPLMALLLAGKLASDIKPAG